MDFWKYVIITKLNFLKRVILELAPIVRNYYSLFSSMFSHFILFPLIEYQILKKPKKKHIFVKLF